MVPTEIIRVSNCLVGLRFATKAACLNDLAKRATRAVGLDVNSVLPAILHREELGSTGLGQGIAVPHARIAGLTEPFALLVCLREPLPFDAVDDNPVDIVCLMLLPHNQPDDAPKALACIAKRLREPTVTKALRRAKEAEAVYYAMTAPA